MFVYDIFNYFHTILIYIIFLLKIYEIDEKYYNLEKHYKLKNFNDFFL